MIRSDFVRPGASGTRLGLVLLVSGGFLVGQARGGTTTYTYDAQGRVVTITTQHSLDHATTTITFDNSDNRTSLVDAYTDATPPNSPTAVTAVAQSYNDVLVKWTDSTDVGGGAVSSYQIYRGGVLIATVSGSASSYSDTSAAPNTPYTYMVAAVDSSGNVSSKVSYSVTTPPAPDTTAPTVPSGLQGAEVSVTWVNLTWGASTDSGGSGLAGYEILRNGGGSPIGTSTVASYADKTVSLGQTYTYQVRAYDGSGNRSGLSNQVSVKIIDSSPPTTPGGLAFSNVKIHSATASWNASSDNVGVTAYRYSLNSGTSWTNVGKVLSVSLTGLAVNTTYTMRVEAGDAAGNWSTAGSGSFTTPASETDTMSMTSGIDPSTTYLIGPNGQPISPSYITIGYDGTVGSLSPNTIPGGLTIVDLAYRENIASGLGPSLFWIAISGFASNPGAGWLISLNTPVFGALSPSAASFSCNGSICSWSWFNITGNLSQSPGSVTIVHQ